MPLGPLPPESTPRYRVHYTVIGKQHTFEIRSHDSPSFIGTFVQDFLTMLDALCFASVIDSVDFAADGSNVFNAVTTGAEAFTWGSGAGTIQEIPQYINFIGRTSGGRRVRLAVFGLGVSAVDYRFVATENADVDNARGVLVAAGGLLRGIDDLTPIWKTYANTGFNAYWQKAVRP